MCVHVWAALHVTCSSVQRRHVRSKQTGAQGNIIILSMEVVKYVTKLHKNALQTYILWLDDWKLYHFFVEKHLLIKTETAIRLSTVASAMHYLYLESENYDCALNGLLLRHICMMLFLPTKLYIDTGVQRTD